MDPTRCCLAAFAVLATGCSLIFDQGGNGLTDFGDDDPMYAELDIGQPVHQVQVVSFGVAELTPGQGPAMPVVHVRLVVANDDDERPWKIDAANALLGVPGRADRPVMFINTDIASVPITRVERGEVRSLDLYFAYPEGFDDPANPPPLAFRVLIATPRRDFVSYTRVGPVDAAIVADARPAGWAPHWWCAPTHPWPTFNRRPGRKTHKVPTEVAITRAPRWPGEREDFTIQNRSSRGLQELRLSPVVEQAWDASLIRPMMPGAEQVVPLIACMRYDVLVVDDHARRCVLPMSQLCYGYQPWVIDDVTLDRCRWAR